MTTAAELMKAEKLDDFDYKVALQQQMVAAANAAAANSVQVSTNGSIHSLQIGPIQVAAPSLNSPTLSDAPPASTGSAEMLAIGPVAPSQPDPSTSSDGPRRLHVSNIPFKYRDPDLIAMFEKIGPVSEVEIIFNERGSKGFGFVTMQRTEDAVRARTEMNGMSIEGRRIEVNMATQRIHTKKKPLIASVAVDPIAAQNALNAQNMQRAALLQQQLIAQQFLLPRQQFIIPPPTSAAAHMQALQYQTLLANQHMHQSLQNQQLLFSQAALQQSQQPPNSMAHAQLFQQQQQQQAAVAALGLDSMAQANQMAALFALDQQQRLQLAVAQGRVAPAVRIPTSSAGGAVPPPPPSGPAPGSLGEQFLQQALPASVTALHHHNLHPAAAAAALQRRYAPY
ncbi:unnamed protein product [Caenorhabditis sp. 36 PRJEB53466]|nr:unnamed protein product [Caenorhabditis sp. 36 PRJEB53466]